jgi:hypothetical protein
MNILPFVFSFLILFSCLAATFLRQTKSMQLIEITLGGYDRAEKALKNACIKRCFEKIKDTPSSSPSSRSAAFHSKHLHYPPLELSKFHLKAFGQVESFPSSHPLYEPLARLLRHLYQERVFAKYSKRAGVEYLLAEALVKKLYKSPNVQYLADLHPDDPELQLLYYKMLKGTNQYTETAGIPPLSHFFSLEPMNKALHLNLASPPILTALFGPKASQEILVQEREHWNKTHKYYALIKKDLEGFLSKEPGLLTAWDPYFSYSRPVAKKTRIARRDKRTGILIERGI